MAEMQGGGPGRSRTVELDELLTLKCGRFGAFDAKRLFSCIPAPTAAGVPKCAPGRISYGLGCTAHDLFGLHPVPQKPTPNYQRLSRYDETGLIWLLEGREVIALTGDTAAIRAGRALRHRLSQKQQAGARSGGRQPGRPQPEWVAAMTCGRDDPRTIPRCSRPPWSDPGRCGTASWRRRPNVTPVGAIWCQWDSSDLAQVFAVAQDGAKRQFMTNRPQAAGLVAEFLRDALAGGALGVPQLEVMARAAGLLGEGRLCRSHRIRPVGSTGLRASTTVAHSLMSRHIDGASF